MLVSGPKTGRHSFLSEGVAVQSADGSGRERDAALRQAFEGALRELDAEPTQPIAGDASLEAAPASGGKMSGSWGADGSAQPESGPDKSNGPQVGRETGKRSAAPQPVPQRPVAERDLANEKPQKGSAGPTTDKALGQREKSGTFGRPKRGAATQPVNSVAVAEVVAPSFAEPVRMAAPKRSTMTQAGLSPAALKASQWPTAETSANGTGWEGVSNAQSAERRTWTKTAQTPPASNASDLLDGPEVRSSGWSTLRSKEEPAGNPASKTAPGSPQLSRETDGARQAVSAATGMQSEGLRAVRSKDGTIAAEAKDGTLGEKAKDAGGDQQSAVSAESFRAANVFPQAVRASAAVSEPLAGQNRTSAVGEAFDALDAGDGRATPVWTHASANRAEAGYQDQELGWVAVRAQMGADGIHAAIVPNSADAAQDLGSHLAGLGIYLAEHRVPVETVTMAASERQGSWSGLEHENGQSPGDQAQQQRSSGQPVVPHAEDGSRSRTAGGAWAGPTAPAVAAWSGGIYVSVIA